MAPKELVVDNWAGCWKGSRGRKVGVNSNGVVDDDCCCLVSRMSGEVAPDIDTDW